MALVRPLPQRDRPRCPQPACCRRMRRQRGRRRPVHDDRREARRRQRRRECRVRCAPAAVCGRRHCGAGELGEHRELLDFGREGEGPACEQAARIAAAEGKGARGRAWKGSGRAWKGVEGQSKACGRPWQFGLSARERELRRSSGGAQGGDRGELGGDCRWRRSGRSVGHRWRDQRRSAEIRGDPRRSAEIRGDPWRSSQIGGDRTCRGLGTNRRSQSFAR